MIAVLTALVCFNLLYFLRIAPRFSNRAAFDRVHIGTSLKEAQGIFAEQSIRCEVRLGSHLAPPDVCIFHDFFGEYVIYFDPNSMRVVRKEQTLFRPQDPR